ncbi:PH domain-containing protein [Natronorubrum aibiense]|uniref:PH domain-containing protein n=1 Tax=Natronorubrum aibiense TaxID=348826 RepID=A0A5P9P0W0_9EURY|nr:PH domain-containing protein [Natronorubrum aibiense]QFU81778.1 PH domain-containing protein [Natronorubrum aibiense]
MTESIDPAVPLDSHESVTWTGRPRITTALPAVTTGLLVIAFGAVSSLLDETLLFLAVVPIGVAIPLWKYLAIQGTQYVITDHALYVKRGVMSRHVTQATLETVQNSAYSQDITGSMFGYGSVEFEIAGGNDLSFQAIDEPREIRSLVDRAASNTDGLGGNDGQESDIPGNLTQWQRIRDEIREIHTTIED